MKRLTLLSVISSFIILSVVSANAGTQDNAVIALHAKPSAKSICTLDAPTEPCSQYTKTHPLLTGGHVYVVAAKADSAAGITGVSLGVDYTMGAAYVDWTTCADGLSFVNAGPNGDWPAAGGGNTITWQLSSCQQSVIYPDGVHAIAGAFYVYAYSDDRLSITDNNNLVIDQQARVTDCTPTESVLSPGTLGSVGFGAAFGLNPCSSGPQVLAVQDIGNDQGRSVRINFVKSTHDIVGSPTPILEYEAYRRIDPLSASAAAATRETGPAVVVSQSAPAPREDRIQVEPLLAGWEFVGSIPAHTELEYNMVVPTLADSTVAAGLHWSVFFIRAATSGPGVFFDSDPDSGYSLDNLAPDAPGTPLLSSISLLTWDDPTDSDFNYFSVYGTDRDDLGPGAVLLGTTPGTSMDVASSPYPFYLVTASDYSGNEGQATNASSTAPTPVGTAVAVQLGPNAQMTFAAVSAPGESQLTPRSSGPSPPGGILIVPSSPAIYYEFTTTATFSGLIEICITYDPANVQGLEDDLSLMHFDESLVPPSWREITTSLDTGSDLICGETSSLYLFAIVEPGSPTDIPVPVIPTAYRLHPSYPNPFTVSTNIRYDLPEPGPVTLQVFDLSGRPVRTLAKISDIPAGTYTAAWNGRNDQGQTMPPGIYFYRLVARGINAGQKVILIR